MYKDDEVARDARSHALIAEIADLERDRVGRAQQDHRLELARRELATLQEPIAPAPERAPGLLTHVLVFGGTAVASFVGYTLLMAR